MGLHAERTAERDALARKVEKIRAELDTYETALDEAEQALADAPEDDESEESVAGAGGAAGQPGVMVQDHT